MFVHRRVTYRLYPSASQAEAMWQIQRAHCALYNAALQERCEAWRKQRLSIGFADQCKSWTVIRREHEEFAQLNAQSGQVTLKRLDWAFSHFFRRVKLGQTPGFPRFKSRFRFPGWGYKSHGDGFRFTPRANGQHGVLRLSGVGKIGARGRARTLGEVITADIRRDARGWLLSVVMRCDPQREGGTRACGLDWGVSDLATLAYADGTTHVVHNDRLFQAQQQKAADAQRAASKILRGKRSSRAKAKHLQIARRHANLAAQRKDRAHKLSARLVAEHALIATEELKIANMTRSAKGTVEQPGTNVAQKSGLNREILDTAPGMLMQLLKYKAEEAGTILEFVNTRKVKPSQTCPRCWARQKKTLAERTHTCGCGLAMSRDGAAALVMLLSSETYTGQKLTPEETPKTPPRIALAI